MASSGLTDRDIAAGMGVTVATVKSYWIRLRNKTGGQNRTDTVVRGMALTNPPRDLTDPSHIWWETICRKAPWLVLATSSKMVVTFMSRPFVRGSSEYMLGRNLISLADSPSQLILEQRIDSLLQGAAFAECKVVLSVTERTSMEMEGRLVLAEEHGRPAGALFFIRQWGREIKIAKGTSAKILTLQGYEAEKLRRS